MTMLREPLTQRLAQLWSEFGGASEHVSALSVEGSGSLPSVFAVSDLAVASVGVAGLSLGAWIAEMGHPSPAMTIDRRLASQWFSTSFKALDWQPPPMWDAFSGDYRGVDGWIRLHTNAAHHRAAAFRVLGQAEDRAALAKAVAGWRIDELEAAVVTTGGCAAAMRGLAEWQAHDVGRAVAAEPLVAVTIAGKSAVWDRPAGATPARPLTGLRVLDLTRILAGPIGTRFLAGYGAEVLRIDPPDWDEGATIPEVTLGKRCARLDLKTTEGRTRLLELLAGADVLVHGYRSDALERLGVGADVRRRVAPHLVDVALDAYGWTTRWAGRRGFDSLVQMSCGIADAGMRRFGTEVPKPLPVQALDHATGYFVAAAALRGLTERRRTGAGSSRRLSLARTAALLIGWGVSSPEAALPPQTDADFSHEVEAMDWGQSLRLLPPLIVKGAPMRWDRPATALGTAKAEWLA